MGSWLVGVLKSITEIAIPIGTGAIVNGVVSEAVKDQSKIIKVCAGVASLFIDIGISKAVTECAHKEIDELDSMITKRLPKGE